MTEYGPEIAVNGVRPEWLRDDDVFHVLDIIDTKWVGGYRKRQIAIWSYVKSIRLPADHPYYLSTSKGFEYWPGGDEAPDDWDRGDIIRRDGLKGFANEWRHILDGGDIIGYRKRKGLPEVPADATMPDDWAIKEAQSRCGHDLGLIPNTAIIELARMIQKHEAERDPDVLAVSEIIRAWDDMPPIDKDGQCFQAALAAYKKHK